MQAELRIVGDVSELADLFARISNARVKPVQVNPSSLRRNAIESQDGNGCEDVGQVSEARVEQQIVDTLPSAPVDTAVAPKKGRGRPRKHSGGSTVETTTIESSPVEATPSEPTQVAEDDQTQDGQEAEPVGPSDDAVESNEFSVVTPDEPVEKQSLASPTGEATEVDDMTFVAAVVKAKDEKGIEFVRSVFRQVTGNENCKKAPEVPKALRAACIEAFNAN